MKSSLLMVGVFALGIVVGLTGLLPEILDGASLYVLYLLMFLVGFGVGAEPDSLAVLKRAGARVFLIPLAVAVGSLGGAAVVAAAVGGVPLREALAVGAGFGYYSLSSLYITEIAGARWGTVALISNIGREILTLLSAPLLARLHPVAPVAAGGATSMDTTLPVITESAGRPWAVPALTSGVVLTLLVPVLVPLLLGVVPG